ncbi:MAG TPA: hypothetical protein VN541_11715, partial [Tepidisphaeraceae bacterium]|nr:hypothetical protein [Tepidisphaeraceae bacterium]
MSLVKKFTEDFTHTARAEGSRIFQGGGAQIDDHGADWVEATVRGGQLYGVTLRRSKGAVRYLCECAHYLNTLEPCKHVWAALVAAEARGLTEQWETSRHLDLIPEDEEEDYEFEHGGPLVLSPVRSSRPQRKTRGKDAKSEWKKSLATLREAMQVTEQHASPNTAWLPGREVIYIVDAARTLEGKGLVVEIAQRERKKNGDWSKPKRQTINAEEIHLLADPHDREILAFLLGAKSGREAYSGYYSYYDYSGASSSFRLGESMTLPLLERMCRTGRCMLRRDAESDATPIAWDEAGTWELWVVARKDAERERFILSGELRRGTEQMELS